jgi:arsenate reductase (glutaredoxin)
MTLMMYGIPNCDSVKKAKDYLNQQGIEFVFHDFKKNGITVDVIQEWLVRIDLNSIINRKGTTWRALSEQEKLSCDQSESALNLLCQKPTLIKRPVLVSDHFILVGFNPENYATFLNKDLL